MKLTLILLIFLLISCNNNDNGFYNNNYSDYSECPTDSSSSASVVGGGGSSSSNKTDTDSNKNNDTDNEQPDNAEQKDIYSLNPDITTCESGHILQNEKNKVLDYINKIRKMHNLPSVKYNFNDDEYVEQCSLIIAANRVLTHTPPAESKCYSKIGSDGCLQSNIFLRTGDEFSISSQNIIDTFLIDKNVADLGHRRWILFPWLNTIAFSRVDGNKTTASALKVINPTFQKISSTLKFVAYPYENYPAKLFTKDTFCSFSVISDTSLPKNNSIVDFSKATIEITDENNKKYSVSNVNYDNANYGIPNILIWKINTNKIEKNLKYFVKIDNVLIKDKKQNYNFWFKLSD